MKRKVCILLSMLLLLTAPAMNLAAAAEDPESTEAIIVVDESAGPETDVITDDSAPAEETAEEDAAEKEILIDDAINEETEAPGFETEKETGAFPQIGDVVFGFEVKQIRPFPAIGAQLVLFEHQRTHAQLMYIANDDTNRVFDLTFFTDAIDKTGLPHVFEHSVLDGSEKYPSKTLWFNVAYQTYNTYMNAFTQSRLTSYPVASLSEAQLLKYADYYTDACLHPMVVEDESIFREEAWRYRLEDAESDLTLEGTVYSEMLGANDLSNAAYNNAMSTAFPGSMIGNEYGGEPDYIPDMTFESLQNYHSLYYHPSNSIAYLYGQFEDYSAFLKQLDEAYAGYEYKEFIHEDPGYTPLTEKTEVSFEYPVEQDSDTENAATIYYAILCPGAEGQQELILNTLTDLLSDNASSLQQSLQAALPSGSFYSFISTDGPDDAILIVAENVNAEDAEVFRDTVDTVLSDIGQNGFPQDLVDGVMTTLRISTLLARENSDVGVSIIPSLAYSHAASGNPFDYVDYVEGMEQMDEWNSQGLYAKAVTEWLLNAQSSALVTTYPEPGKKEENDAALAEKLAQIKAGMTDEEIAALVEAANAQEPEEDNTAAIADMQAVTVESLPESKKLYEVSDATDESGIRRIDVPAQVDGVGEAGLYLDAAGIAQDDVHWLQLLSDLAGELDTKTHTKAEVASLVSRYLNSANIGVTLIRKPDGYHPYLSATWIALDEDLSAGYDLVHELLFEQKLEDTQKLQEALASLKADLKTGITQAPYSTQLLRAYAVKSEMYRYYSYCKQLEYYEFLEETEALLESDPQTVTDRLQAVADQMNNRTNAVSIYCGNQTGIEANRPIADAFLESLGEEPVEPAVYDFPVPAASEALIIDSSVQFNGELADYATLGLEGYEGDLDAVTSLVLDSLLYPQLRDQYGAYGVFHGANEYEGIYIVSYRDPNIAQTFDVYSQLHDQVSALENDQSVLDGYILSAYAVFAKSEGELTGALNAAVSALQEEPQDKDLEYMRQLKQVTPETVSKYSDLYEKLDSEGVKFTAGPASAINAEADRYEVILNPFGAVDYSQAGFEDVPEDAEYYEAVMSVLEGGMMAPVSDTAFGAEDPATEGDLIAALYVMMGGSANVDEAVETFAQYGLTDIDPDAILTGTDADELLNWISGGFWQNDSGSKELTRAQLAQLLGEFTEAMQSAQGDAAA